MAHASNSVLLAIAFVEGSAALILLVIYALLSSAVTALYFRYWLGGWAFFFVLESSKIAPLSRGITGGALVAYCCSLLMAAFFFAAAIECAGFGKRLKYFASWAITAFAGLAALYFAKLSVLAQWGQSLLEAALLLTAGWTLWRSQSRHRGLGWKLLSAGLLLAGINSLSPSVGSSESRSVPNFRSRAFRHYGGNCHGRACSRSRPGA